MDIHLNENDLTQMPPALRNGLLRWQMTRISAIGQTPIHRHPTKPKETVNQLSLLTEPENQVPEHDETNQTHITLTQLFDAGITKAGMPIRVRLKKDIAKKRCRSYINSMEISDRGTIILEGQEYDKPSPLATKINGSNAGGWEYIEVKIYEQWVRLEQLRQSLKQTTSN